MSMLTVHDRHTAPAVSGLRGRSQLELALDMDVSQRHRSNRYWDVVRVNAAAPVSFGSFIGLSQQPITRNFLRIMFDPKAMRPFVHNWAEVAASLLERVHREPASGVIDDRLQQLTAELKAQLPGLQGPGRQDSERAGPLISIDFMRNGPLLKYFSMVSTTAAATGPLRATGGSTANATSHGSTVQMPEDRKGLPLWGDPK